jgi:hypothetical protein
VVYQSILGSIKGYYSKCKRQVPYLKKKDNKITQKGIGKSGIQIN